MKSRSSMTLRLCVAITALAMASVGCGEKKTKKRKPANKEAKGSPVTPGDQPEAAPQPGTQPPATPSQPAVVVSKTPAPPVTKTAPSPVPARPVVTAKTAPVKPAPTPVATAKPAPTPVVAAKPTPAPVVPTPAKLDPSRLKVQKQDPPTRAAGTPPMPEKRVSGPVALVNGLAIDSTKYYAEVDKIAKRSSKIPPERMNRIKENILKRLIEKELIRQAVKKGAITVPAGEIDKEFGAYKKRFRTEDQFKNYLKHGKVTIESIRGRIQEKKELEKLLEKSGKLAVTDAEVADFYKKNERFYQEREGVKARHILIKVKQKDTPENEAKAKAKLNQALKALKGGMAFDEVAKKFSEGPSAPKGGALGFFGRGQMVKAFEEKAFTMKAKEVSEPVRTRFGWHVIEVQEKREARKKSLDEVKKTITDSLRNKKFFQERRTMLNKLKQEAKIERKITIPKAPARPSPVRGASPHGRRGPGAVPPTGRRVRPTPGANPHAPTRPGARTPTPRRVPTPAPAAAPKR